MAVKSRATYVLSAIVMVAACVSVPWLLPMSSWNFAILALLLGLTVVGDFLEVDTKTVQLSGAFLAIGLAMALLGPVPAALISVASTAVDCARRRPRFIYAFSNFAIFAAFPLVGGALLYQLGQSFGLETRDLDFAGLVVVSFVLANALNFLFISATRKLVDGFSLIEATRKLYVPLLPSQLAVAVLAALIVYAHAHGGGMALVLLVGVVVLYQYLLRELLVSKERAEQLEKRGTQLASLQVGVLTAMLQTLSLRDKMTARHCAAVARYSRELAAEAGCDDEVQELVHTAGLLHDIGKFIFPDRILLANSKLTDEDWEIVKMHPAQGAKVVRQVEGYGPVADIILAHHEKIDGKGYPRGLKGEEIPLLSKIISIADTYDVMTARDSYRDPVAPSEAVAELRRVSGTQLDGGLVELFVKVLERKGVAFHHGDDADFESELDLERRVRAYAAPR
jgi:putative nucleotidyltransferase with HDIG domain